jgi:hypothetical protein
MKIMKIFSCVALAAVVSVAYADTDSHVAHTHLLEIDLAGLTQAEMPDWRVPAAMARSDAGAVYVHRTLDTLEGGYSLAAVYAWEKGAWRPLGWRMMHPTVARNWSGEKVLSDPGALPGKRFAVNAVSGDGPRLHSENYCTDAPNTHRPDDTFGHEIGDTATYSWTNPAQGCEYETEYEVKELPDDSIGWIVIDFRYTLQTGDDDEDGPDQDPE